MTDVFDALSHRVRRHLADELRGGPRRAGDLGTTLGISREAVSKHLRAMVAGRVVSVEPHGRERIYRLDPAGLQQVDDWLRPYRDFWEQRLDALATEIDRHREGA